MATYVKIEVTHRIFWRRSESDYDGCKPEAAMSPANFFPGEGTVECRVGCSGTIGALSFYCTDFSTEDDWVTGERTYLVDTNRLGLLSDTFEAS